MDYNTWNIRIKSIIIKNISYCIIVYFCYISTQ